MIKVSGIFKTAIKQIRDGIAALPLGTIIPPGCGELSGLPRDAAVDVLDDQIEYTTDKITWKKVLQGIVMIVAATAAMVTVVGAATAAAGLTAGQAIAAATAASTAAATAEQAAKDEAAGKAPVDPVEPPPPASDYTGVIVGAVALAIILFL